MKNNERFIIAIVFFSIIILTVYREKELKKELSDLRTNKVLNDSLLEHKSNRVKTYLKITLKQQNIIHTFKSSREKCDRDTSLQNLMQKL